MMDHAPLLLWLLPLVLVGVFRGKAVSSLLLVVTITHHHLEPLPGSAEVPAPLCCLLAQGVEPEPLIATPEVTTERAYQFPSFPLIPRFTPQSRTIRAPPTKFAAVLRVPSAPGVGGWRSSLTSQS